jgi:hypothetical protein
MSLCCCFGFFCQECKCIVSAPVVFSDSALDNCRLFYFWFWCVGPFGCSSPVGASGPGFFSGGCFLDDSFQSSPLLEFFRDQLLICVPGSLYSGFRLAFGGGG